MKTRLLYTKVWSDSYVRSLTDIEFRVFMFYLFNEKVNLSGIYQCPDFFTLAYLSTCDDSRLKKIKDKFIQDEKILFAGDWVYLLNNLRYNRYLGKNNEKALEQEMSELPLSVYSFFNDTHPIPLRYPFGGSIIHTNHNNNHNHIEEPQKVDSDLTPEQVQENMSKLRGIMQEKGLLK